MIHLTLFEKSMFVIIAVSCIALLSIAFLAARNFWIGLRCTLLLFMVVLLATPVFAASECFTTSVCGAPLANPYTTGGFNACVVDVNGNTCTSGGGTLPSGATPVTGTFSGADTTTQAITLAGTAGKTTYICSFSVSGLGATAGTSVTVTVATLLGSSTLSYSYFYQAGATVANTPLVVNYPQCIAANAAATAITITVPGAAGNTLTQINASGFQQ
jgi:hypothetical protein